MTDTEITPALTPDEWARRANGDARLSNNNTLVYDSIYTIVDNRHALAALALHGQPFGFTRDDLEVVREQRLMRETDRMVCEEKCEFSATDRAERDVARLAALEAKIAALLPPEA